MRTVLLAAAIVTLTLHQGWAQFGDMPGLPSESWNGFGRPPTPTPAECQRLLSMRDEVRKHREAIDAAVNNQENVQVACKLMRNYLNANWRWIVAIEADGARCGVLLKIVRDLRFSHVNVQKMAKPMCDMAARGLNRDVPDLGDDRSLWPPDPTQNSSFPTGDFGTPEQFQRPFGR